MATEFEIVPSGVPPELAAYVVPLERQTDVYKNPQTGIEVWLPLKYKAKAMVFGNGESSNAVVTSWGDPWNIYVDNKTVDHELLNNTAIAAPHRLLTGLPIIIANLARNPQINRLVVWDGGPFDQNAEAQIPRRHLFALFENGVDDEGVIIGTSYQFPPELIENGGINIVRQIIENVELVGPISDKTDLKNSLLVPNNKQAYYMEPHIFPEFEIKLPETLPSEGVNIEVREKSIPNAWLRLLDRVILYGEICQLETDGATVQELPFVRVVIENPRPEDFFVPPWALELENLDLTPESLEKYYTSKILPHPSYLQEIYPGVSKFVRPEGVSYLYSELLFYYTRDKKIDAAVYQMAENEGLLNVLQYLRQNASTTQKNAEEIAQQVLQDSNLTDKEKAEILLEIFIPPVNQVQKLIERIKTMPDDADKTLFLWKVEEHGLRNSGRPCFHQASLLVRDDKIHMKAVFRSHDLPKGWFTNVYGVWRLLVDICQETGYQIGDLVIESESGHSYLGDIKWVKELVQKEIWEAPAEKRFIPETMQDPRGNWSIDVDREKNQIVAVLRDPTSGDALMELNGRTAKSIIAQMRNRKLLSDANHALDLGAELARAEFANLIGTLYTQDKPIDFRKFRNNLISSDGK